MIWSSASSAKLTVISSTTGRIPAIAAPTPVPTIVFSEIGVSRTRASPNCFISPSVTLNAPSKTPMSSPIMKTVSSRSISSRSAALSASRIRIVAIRNRPRARPPRHSSTLDLSAGALLRSAAAALRRLPAVGGAGLVEVADAVLLRGLPLALAAEGVGCALVDRVPALALLLDDVEVVVERVERRLR